LSDANGTLIQSVRNGDSDYNAVIEVDQLEKILGYRIVRVRTVTARRIVA
jgi:hypothetical protein